MQDGTDGTNRCAGNDSKMMDNWYQHAVTKQSEYGIILQRQYDYVSSLVLLRNGLLISCLMVYSNESPCILQKGLSGTFGLHYSGHYSTAHG